MSMNKKIAILFLATMVVCASGLYAQTAPFEPVYTGYTLEAPINTQKLASAIRLGLAHYNWVVIEEAEGSITARFEKSNGSIYAVIKVVFDKNSYHIEYVDSKNLDADLEEKIIHRNYMRWIRNLDKYIYMHYNRN